MITNFIELTRSLWFWFVLWSNKFIWVFFRTRY